MLTVVVVLIRACNKNKISHSNTVISTLGSINRLIRACRVGTTSTGTKEKYLPDLAL